MSIYSDYKVGALTEEEFERLAAIENRREREYEDRDNEEGEKDDD